MQSPEIIYQDENVLVVNKPAGLVVHPDGHSSGPFLTDFILENFPETKGVGEPAMINGQEFDRPGIVHRLDKDTSGVMIVAKNQKTFLFLKEQFLQKTTKKKYLAILAGEMKKDIGKEEVIDLPIGRSGSDPRRRVANEKAKGVLRPAVTRYSLVTAGAGFSIVEAYPETGRTHQLRAHFKAIQYPIACDELYGTGDRCPVGLSRQALHAHELSIEIPEKGRQTFTALSPDDMARALDSIGNPW